MLTMLAAIAEFEKGIMLERQREGIDIAKEDGKYKAVNRLKKRSCSKCGPSSRVAQVLAKQSLK